MIARVSKECHVDIDEDSYVDKFKPYLMDVCHAWCNGSSFMEVCRKTDIFEGSYGLRNLHELREWIFEPRFTRWFFLSPLGSIIRSFRRMEEALRQLVQATRSIGNSELEKKFNESIVALKRGIAFAASLYL